MRVGEQLLEGRDRNFNQVRRLDCLHGRCARGLVQQSDLANDLAGIDPRQFDFSVAGVLRDDEMRQTWQEAKEKRIQDALAHWEHMQLRDRYKELKYSVKVQKKRWREVLRNLHDALPAPA